MDRTNPYRIDWQYDKLLGGSVVDGDKPPMRAIGERLQARAKELGLSDAEVARRLGLAQARYSNYVNGNREPDLATFGRICRALSITPNELLGFEVAASHQADLRVRIDALLDGLDPERLDLALALIKALVAHHSP